MKIYWDDCRRWEVTVSRDGDKIHVRLTQDPIPSAHGEAPGFRPTCEIHWGRFPGFKAYGCRVDPKHLERALGHAQYVADKKNMAEHVANERVRLLSITEAGPE